MKKKKTYNVPFAKLPDYNRQAFTDMLVAGENIVPRTNRSLLIDEPFFYSHEWDVEDALTGYLNHEWGKRKYASAVSEAEQLREYFLKEEKLNKIPYGCDANSIFKSPDSYPSALQSSATGLKAY